MQYQEALNKAREIIKSNPEFILCGSLALMFQKVLPIRDIGDLDFVCFRETFKSNHLLTRLNENDTETNVYVRVNKGYLCYELDIDTTTHYNIFVFDKTEDIKFKVVDGLMVQTSDQILKYKKAYNREKDQADLNNIIFEAI